MSKPSLRLDPINCDCLSVKLNNHVIHYITALDLRGKLYKSIVHMFNTKDIERYLCTSKNAFYDFLRNHIADSALDHNYMKPKRTYLYNDKFNGIFQNGSKTSLVKLTLIIRFIHRYIKHGNKINIKHANLLDKFLVNNYSYEINVYLSRYHLDMLKDNTKYKIINN